MRPHIAQGAREPMRRPLGSRWAKSVVLVLVVVASTASFASGSAHGQAQVVTEVVASGLDWPVSFAFAPDGRILFNERYTGRVRSLVDGQVEPGEIGRVPVLTQGEQGLLGLALDPAFASSPWVYVYHTYLNATLLVARNRVVRLLAAPSAPPPDVILDGIPAGAFHNGGIIGFSPDGTLFVTTGDATLSNLAQDNASLAGKILRVNRDGTIPADNPIPGSPVFTLGHRNVFGLAFHPVTGRPYVSENGPDRDDEVNLLVPGGNYGWPSITGDGNLPGFIDPIVTYSGVIAPTGVGFYTGSADPTRRDSLLLGDWNRGVLQRIELAPPAYDAAVRAEGLAGFGAGGILDLEMGPDGHVYVSTPSAIHRVRLTAAGPAGAGLEPGLLVALVTIAGVGGAFLAAILLRFRRTRP